MEKLYGELMMCIIRYHRRIISPISCSVLTKNSCFKNFRLLSTLWEQD